MGLKPQNSIDSLWYVQTNRVEKDYFINDISPITVFLIKF